MSRTPKSSRSTRPAVLLLSAAVTLAAGAVLAQQVLSDTEAAPSVTVAFEAQPVRRCLNVAAALEAPPGEDWGYTIRHADFARIRSAGFDTIRLPVKWSAYTGPAPDYQIDPVLLAEVEAHVRAALHQHLQVLLNVHHFDAFNARPEAEEARLIAIWHQLSAHFEGWGDALIFELLNEPHFDDVYGRGDEDYSKPDGIARMNRINRALVSLIRERHSERWLVLGSSQWGSHYPLTEGVNGVRFTPDADPRVITTFHYYEPLPFTHQALEFSGHPPFPGRWGSPGDRRHVSSAFSDVARFREGAGQGMPVLLGEFGVSTETPPDQRAAYTAHVRQQSERYGMGWCAFDFASPGFGMFDTRTDKWDGVMLRALGL